MGPPNSLSDLLTGLDELNATALDQLHWTDTERLILVRLLETSCLLELAKLAGAQIDVASYLQLACDVICQFLPVEGCIIEVDLGEGLVAFDCGLRPIALTARADRPIDLDGTTVGRLLIGPLRAELPEGSMWISVAHQISQGLSTVHAAEVLRRRAAAESASRLAGTVPASDPIGAIDELTRELANLPGALAAELTADHPALGPVHNTRAGYWDDNGLEHPIHTLIEGGVQVRVRFSRSLDDSTTESVANVISHLLVALDRIADTRRLEHERDTDPLTGLGNRRRLERALTAGLARTKRMNEPLALVIMDLDHFKKVNDLLGHSVGDDVLVATAKAIGEAIRPYDEAVRFGGEEFIIVAPATDLLGAAALADRLSEHVPLACIEVLPPDWRQTVSIGVSAAPDHGVEADELIAAADAALYEAKGAGRDRIVYAGDRAVAIEPIGNVMGETAEPTEPSTEVTAGPRSDGTTATVDESDAADDAPIDPGSGPGPKPSRWKWRR